MKFGTDLVVGETDLNFQLMEHIALQVLALRHENTDVVIVTSGARKYGEKLAERAGYTHQLSKTEATRIGLNPLMEAWKKTLQYVGLSALALTITGKDLTVKKMEKLRSQARRDSLGTTYLVNTNDAENELLDLRIYKYAQIAGDNDKAAARFAQFLSRTLILCTQVEDGVIGTDGKTIRVLDDIEQKKNIASNGKSNGGTGGMESKVDAAISFTQSGTEKAAYIVNGRAENILLRVLQGDSTGTKIQIKEKGTYEKE